MKSEDNMKSKDFACFYENKHLRILKLDQKAHQNFFPTFYLCHCWFFPVITSQRKKETNKKPQAHVQKVLIYLYI
jgi:hypothetical protein